jgi:hypothetical protein
MAAAEDENLAQFLARDVDIDDRDRLCSGSFKRFLGAVSTRL